MPQTKTTMSVECNDPHRKGKRNNGGSKGKNVIQTYQVVCEENRLDIGRMGGGEAAEFGEGRAGRCKTLSTRQQWQQTTE